MAETFQQATAAEAERTGAIYTSAGYDVIALLPAAASERLRQLRQKAHDAHALIPEFADRQDANSARGDMERRIQRLVAPRAENGFALREGDPQVVQARQELARLTDEAARLAERYEVRSEQWVSTSRVLQAVETWLRDGKPNNTVLQDQEVEVKLNKGEDILSALERIRRRGRELLADANRIRSAPFPASYAKQQMRAQIEALAQAGTPDVTSLIEHNRPVAFAMQRVTSSILNAQPGAVGFAELEAAVPLLVWLHKAALVAALDRAIDNEADDKSAMPHEARQKAEAEIQGDLLEVERQEAQLVFSAQEQGLPAEHRSDISPLALLGIRLVTAPRASPLGTSLEHAIDIIGLRR